MNLLIELEHCYLSVPLRDTCQRDRWNNRRTGVYAPCPLCDVYSDTPLYPPATVRAAQEELEFHLNAAHEVYTAANATARAAAEATPSTPRPCPGCGAVAGRYWPFQAQFARCCACDYQIVAGEAIL